jgi:hypothetical protein
LGDITSPRPPHQGEEEIPPPLFPQQTGGQMGPPPPPAPRGQEQICGAEPRHPQANLERRVSMATPPPRDPGIPGSQLQLLRGEVGGGAAPIPPSQALIRLQLAVGPPHPISRTKAGREPPVESWSLCPTSSA